MEILTILFFVVFLLAIPPTLIKVIGEQYREDRTMSNAIIKLTLSFLVYVGLSLITPLFVLFVYVGADPRPSHTTSFEDKVIGLIGVFIYGIFGWLLCSLVYGKIVKPWKIFSFKKEPPVSVYDSK